MSLIDRTKARLLGGAKERSAMLRGIKSARNAEELVAKARARASLTESRALRLAVAETRAARRR
jgi:hypothetical protein